MGVKILFFSRGTLGQNSMFPEKGGQNSIFFPNALKKGGQNRGAYQPTSLKGCPPRVMTSVNSSLLETVKEMTIISIHSCCAKLIWGSRKNILAYSTVSEQNDSVGSRCHILHRLQGPVFFSTTVSIMITDDLIESTRTMSMEDVGTWVLEKIKNI